MLNELFQYPDDADLIALSINRLANPVITHKGLRACIHLPESACIHIPPGAYERIRLPE